MIKDDRRNLRFFGFLHPIGIARRFSLGCAVAFRIDIGGEENILPVWRPQFAASFSGDGRQLVHSSDSASRAIEVGNPDLPAAFPSRDKSKPLSIRKIG